jgi:peptidyl-prolyl cis-trans isomerase-like protein 2
VGGGDALTSIEAVPTDGDDRPRDRVEIKGVTVYVDPFEEGRKAEREAKDGKAVKAGPGRGAYAAPRPAGGGTAAAVGRYLRPEGAGAAAAPAPKKARTANPFDAW